MRGEPPARSRRPALEAIEEDLAAIDQRRGDGEAAAGLGLDRGQAKGRASLSASALAISVCCQWLRDRRRCPSRSARRGGDAADAAREQRAAIAGAGEVHRLEGVAFAEQIDGAVAKEADPRRAACAVAIEGADPQAGRGVAEPGRGGGDEPGIGLGLSVAPAGSRTSAAAPVRRGGASAPSAITSWPRVCGSATKRVVMATSARTEGARAEQLSGVATSKSLRTGANVHVAGGGSGVTTSGAAPPSTPASAPREGEQRLHPASPRRRNHAARA